MSLTYVPGKIKSGIQDLLCEMFLISKHLKKVFNIEDATENKRENSTSTWHLIRNVHHQKMD